MHADSLTLQFCLISDKVFLCRLLLLQAAQRQITQNLPLQSVNPHLDQSLFTRCAEICIAFGEFSPKSTPCTFTKSPLSMDVSAVTPAPPVSAAASPSAAAPWPSGLKISTTTVSRPPCTAMVAAFTSR